ncbi:MAG TPA: septum formation initiator family protein [Deltaproteobacteria bacterium]|nr:septum formation initiator family protein [Deltaproteobacteria bacterium]
MGLRQKILLTAAVLILCSLGGLIILGDNGLSELKRLRKELDGIVADNRSKSRENLSMYREIERLKSDYEYIEDVARNQLGVIGKDEVILKIKENGSK